MNWTSNAKMTSLGANISDNSSYDDYYEYYYDYDDSINNIPLDELVPVTLTYSLTLLLGLVGNCLVIFSISYYRRMRTVTNVFLLSLASADLLLVLICVPIKVGLSLFLLPLPFLSCFSFLLSFVQFLSSCSSAICLFLYFCSCD